MTGHDLGNTLIVILVWVLNWEQCEHFWGVAAWGCAMGTGVLLICLLTVGLALGGVKGIAIFFVDLAALAIFAILGWFPLWTLFIIALGVVLTMATRRGGGGEGTT